MLQTADNQFQVLALVTCHPRDVKRFLDELGEKRREATGALRPPVVLHRFEPSTRRDVPDKRRGSRNRTPGAAFRGRAAHVADGKDDVLPRQLLLFGPGILARSSKEAVQLPLFEPGVLARTREQPAQLPLFGPGFLGRSREQAAQLPLFGPVALGSKRQQ